MGRPRVFHKPTHRVRGKQAVEKPRKKYDRSQWPSRSRSYRQSHESQSSSILSAICKTKVTAARLTATANKIEDEESIRQAAFLNGVNHVQKQLEEQYGITIEIEEANGNVLAVKANNTAQELLVVPRTVPTSWA